ncbi:MAG: ATP-binding protein [Roseinatronobacter sp.]
MKDDIVRNTSAAARPEGQARVRTWFDRLLERTAEADSFRVNLALIIVIVIGSMSLSLLLLQVVAPIIGLEISKELTLLVALIATIVPMAIGIPGVLFGDALVRRVHSIKKELEQALVGATLASRAKSEFLANISHEIRTPMNGVLGMAQVLETTPLSDQQREHVRLIRDSGDMLMALIDDVLDLARIEAGKLSLNFAPHPLAQTVADTVALFAARAAENGTSLDFTASGDLPEMAVFDQLRVRQCLGNLVSNAVKFTRKGKVTVAASCLDHGPEGIEISLSVTDTGIGISSEGLAKLFTPFAQASTQTAQDYGGTGLGLSISRRLARKMGGDLTVTSQPGEGSRFVLRFRATRVASDTQLAVPEQAEASALSLDGLILLIVDDSAANRRVAAAMLAPLGVRCIPADGGAQALALLAEHRCNGVLLDMQMPDMDGPETVRAIRASGAPWANIPVIALTANAMPGERERCLEMGMQGYATKPIRMALLRNEIAKVLNRGPDP